MRKFLFIAAIGLLFMVTNAEAQTFAGVDRSPLDLAYHPNNLPQQNLRNDYQEPMARLIYSRPAKNGREIFGTNLAEYGKVWRLGANENTELTLYRNATIGGVDVPAGSYSVAAIPSENNWVIIINKTLHNWGAYRYKEDADVVRVEVPLSANDEVVENFSAIFTGEGDSATLHFAWDKVKASLPIQFK